MKIFTFYSKSAFIILLIALCLCSSLCTAQTVMYGMTSRGGSNGDGAIIKFNTATNKDCVVWSFGSGNDGQTPGGDLTYDASNGLFYGMTSEGGSDSEGTIISFDPLTNSENVVWSFGSENDGQNPNGNLVYNADGNIFYGMTYRGGSVDEGVIFSFNPNGNSESVLWNFGSGTDGQHPTGDLVYDTGSELYYGTTEDGGSSGGYGTIFTFNTSTNKDSVVWNFGKGYDASGPGGDLIYDATTELYYGMTQYGGKNDLGAIFSFNTITNRDSVLWSLKGGADGKYPDRSLVYNTANELYYGLIYLGGSNDDGVIISFNPANDSEKVVWNFAGEPLDGAYPQGNLVYDANNELFYGMSADGGSNSGGTIFSFNTTTNADSLLWSLGGGTDGANPSGDLVFYTVTTGINQLSVNSNQLSIYPNPASGQFIISGLKSGQVIELFNYLGQELNSMIAGNTVQQMNISAQANGIYLVRILNTDGTIADEQNMVKIN